MGDTRQHVLVVGAKQAGLERLAPIQAAFGVSVMVTFPFWDIETLLRLSASMSCRLF